MFIDYAQKRFLIFSIIGAGKEEKEEREERYP